MLTRSVAGALLLSVLPLSGAYQRIEIASARFTAQEAAPALSDSAFAALVARISEPGGYFDSDNLISNESSYLHVLGGMRRIGVTGGTYIGVGPDQNFSYMAQVRPRMAFMIDIRRDNLLQHLLFKALFEMARNRVEYLALLTGRAVPNDMTKWNRRSITEIVDFIDKSPPDPDQFETTRSVVRTKLRRYGVPVTPAELETIGRIQQAFFDAGLDLKFTSLGRAPRDVLPDASEAPAGEGPDRQAAQLPRQRGWLPVREVARGEEPGDPGRRQPRGHACPSRDRTGDGRARREALGAVRVERGVLSDARGKLRRVRRQRANAAP